MSGAVSRMIPRSVMRPSAVTVARRAVLPGVERGGDRAERWIAGEHLGEPQRLVVREGVHRVEDEGLHAGDAVAAGTQHVVEDRVEERLGLARARARGHQRRERTAPPAADRRREARECRRLVPVGHEALVPLEGFAPALVGRAERQPQTRVRALEHARRRIGQEQVERLQRIGIAQGEGRDEVVEQPAPDARGLHRRQQLAHVRSASRAEKCAYAWRMSASRSRVAYGSS